MGVGVNQGPLESLVAGQCQVIAGPDGYRANLESSPGWRVSQISCHDSLGVPPGYLFSPGIHVENQVNVKRRKGHIKGSEF